jgi:hypothetical protein
MEVTLSSVETAAKTAVDWGWLESMGRSPKVFA